MDKKNAIELNNVHKSFKVYVVDKNKKTNMFQKTPTYSVEREIIRGITLSVKKGEVLGVIGRNGSGKSTLLSLISRIYEPDSGSITCSGKIASILELGMGFHPDMTGRENIYLKGELYGFTKNTIDQKIETIIDYSGLREYIDYPIRTYSSGMSANSIHSAIQRPISATVE